MSLPSAVHVSSTFEFGAMLHDCLSVDPQVQSCIRPFFLSLVKNASVVSCLVSRFLDPYFLFPITIDYIVYSAPVSLLVFFWKHSNFGLNVQSSFSEDKHYLYTKLYNKSYKSMFSLVTCQHFMCHTSIFQKPNFLKFFFYLSISCKYCFF